MWIGHHKEFWKLGTSLVLFLSLGLHELEVVYRIPYNNKRSRYFNLQKYFPPSLVLLFSVIVNSTVTIDFLKPGTSCANPVTSSNQNNCTSKCLLVLHIFVKQKGEKLTKTLNENYIVKKSPYTFYSKMANILVSFCLLANQPCCLVQGKIFFWISSLKTRQ